MFLFAHFLLTLCSMLAAADYAQIHVRLISAALLLGYVCLSSYGFSCNKSVSTVFSWIQVIRHTVVNGAVNTINAGSSTNAVAWQNVTSPVPHAYPHTSHHGVPILSCQWHHPRELRQHPSASLTHHVLIHQTVCHVTLVEIHYTCISSNSWLSSISDMFLRKLH